MEEKNTPNYFGILPANVRYDKRLKPMEKILYTEITALSNAKGYCYATNSYFAELYGVHKNTAGAWINNLEKLGYIKSKIIYEEGTKNIKERRLFLFKHINENIDTYQQKDCDPINEKIDTPINEKIEDNNTRINNTSSNKKKINKKENTELIIESIYKSEKFKETFNEFIDMRKSIKKPATNKAMEMIIKKLEKVDNEELAIKMLERSIINNWQDVYEERSGNGKKFGANNKREVITRDYNDGAEIFNQ
jgi:hypothetical protein